LFNLSSSMISRWRLQKLRFLSTDSKRFHLPGAGRPLSFPELERKLSRWIVENRASGYPVTYSDIKDESASWFVMRPLRSHSGHVTDGSMGFSQDIISVIGRLPIVCLFHPVLLMDWILMLIL